MEDLQAAVGTAQLQVLGIAVRSRHNRAVLLPHGLYPRLTRLIQVSSSTTCACMMVRSSQKKQKGT